MMNKEYNIGIFRINKGKNNYLGNNRKNEIITKNENPSNDFFKKNTDYPISKVFLIKHTRME